MFRLKQLALFLLDIHCAKKVVFDRPYPLLFVIYTKGVPQLKIHCADRLKYLFMKVFTENNILFYTNTIFCCFCYFWLLNYTYFDVLLAVHLTIILVINKLDAQSLVL